MNEPRLNRLRTRWAAVGAAVAVIFGAGGIGIANATQPAGAVTFVPITPCRIFDTRPDTTFNVGARNTPLGPSDTYTISAHGNPGKCTGIPTSATGLSLNVTTLDATLLTFLTIWPTGQPQPDASSLNPSPGQPPTPNAVTTALSPTGQFDIYNLQGTVHVLADVNGYYTGHHHDDRYYTKAQTDDAIAAAQEVITLGGADDSFVFPASQATFGTTTFTTASAGRLHARLLAAGGLGCASSFSYYAWLEIDGAPIRSSLISIGENAGGFITFNSDTLDQKVVEGVTSGTVAAGTHQLRGQLACTTGAVDYSSGLPEYSGVVTVLPPSG